MARGGKREGAGRPRGSKEAHVLEREATLAAYRARVCKVADDLLDAELTAAKGMTFLFRKKKGEKAERVTDEETIKQFIDGELASTDEDEFYFITSERPDTSAIRGILDRTFDRPAQRMELTGAGGTEPISTVVKHIYEAEQK